MVDILHEGVELYRYFRNGQWLMCSIHVGVYLYQFIGDEQWFIHL